MKKHGEIQEDQLSKNELNELAETLLRGEGGDNAESTETQSLDENAFGDEGTIELTEVVEEGNPREDSLEIEVNVDSPEERYGELCDEALRIGLLVEEYRILEGNIILAKARFSGELYTTMCISEGIEVNEAIANMRDVIHILLKDGQPGFIIFGGKYANYIHLQWKEVAYNDSINADHFKDLSKEAERAIDRRDDEKIASRKAKEQQQNAS